MRIFLPLLLLLSTFASPAAAPAQAAPAQAVPTQVTPAQATVGASAETRPAPAPNDYSKPENWLCLPGRQDACAVDLTTTVIAADGSMSKESWTAPTNPKIDCFYVYPTVSLEPTISSDMMQGPAEKSVVRTQFARFGQVCRQFAPMYRQVTMFGLLARMGGRPIPQAQVLAYSDVADAWHYYLEHDNHGRGVILIGHSQGGNLLRQLIQNEIDGKPIESRIVAAALVGATVAVPRNAVVGGSFTHMPLCRSASQTGCIITYESFPADYPPTPGGLFGAATGEGMVAACTNPAALGGGSGVLHAYLSAHAREWVNVAQPGAWLKADKPVTTPFVSLPGMLTAECATSDGLNYLAVTVNKSEADARTGDIHGEVVVAGQVRREWGLHTVDMSLAQGNLIQIFAQQSKAWLAAQH
jgi:pimeloyl-ACP methyl ester carboxylesterase